MGRNQLITRRARRSANPPAPSPPPLLRSRTVAAILRQDVEKLSRTHSFCGFTGTTAFPQCEAVIRCFDDNKSLQAWSTCMEDNIHADMHGWLGGAWGCEVSTRAYHDNMEGIGIHRVFWLKCVFFRIKKRGSLNITESGISSVFFAIFFVVLRAP